MNFALTFSRRSPSPESLYFIIPFEPQKPFWETADNGKTYHILRPGRVFSH